MICRCRVRTANNKVARGYTNAVHCRHFDFKYASAEGCRNARAVYLELSGGVDDIQLRIAYREIVKARADMKLALTVSITRTPTSAGALSGAHAGLGR